MHERSEGRGFKSPQRLPESGGLRDKVEYAPRGLRSKPNGDQWTSCPRCPQRLPEIKMQLIKLNKRLESALRKEYGTLEFNPIFGAGCLKNPIVLVFMNPTYRNVSSHKGWRGIQAPWIGVRYVWKFFHLIGAVGEDTLQEINSTKKWTEDFAEKVYGEVASNGFYITNISKHTQSHSDMPKDNSYELCMPYLLEELQALKPRYIVTLGAIGFKSLTGLGEFSERCNKMLKSKKIAIYASKDKKLNNIVPCFYPVGRAQFNMGKAVGIIKIINSTNI